MKRGLSDLLSRGGEDNLLEFDGRRDTGAGAAANDVLLFCSDWPSVQARM